MPRPYVVSQRQGRTVIDVPVLMPVLEGEDLEGDVGEHVRDA